MGVRYKGGRYSSRNAPRNYTDEKKDFRIESEEILFYVNIKCKALIFRYLGWTLFGLFHSQEGLEGHM